MALHVTPKPGKPTHERTMHINPVTAEPRQTYSLLPPHKADRRDHRPPTGAAGAPPYALG